MAEMVETASARELAKAGAASGVAVARKSSATVGGLMPANKPIHLDEYPNLYGNPQSAPRCGAYARTTGKPCKSPAVRGKKRCRMHGGAKGSGGQRGNQNAVTFGEYTATVNAFGFFTSFLRYCIDGDGRRRKSRVTREIEVRELLGLLWILGAHGSAHGEADPLRLVAINLAEEAGIDWSPPEP